MQEYKVKVKFSDGQYVIIEVEAEDESDALNKAMPVDLEIR